MPIKIERRQPVTLYRKRREAQFRDRIPLAAIAKYGALTIAGLLLFRAGQAHALIERGYEALGGEAFALFLPGMYWMTSRITRDILDIKEDKHDGE